MTTYAYDNWIQLPTRDLYDTQVMAMAINAAKDMYEKGEQRIKDFNTAYGDFVTPIQADQDWYNQNVTGKVRDTINNLYARGIDPLRSAEGRAIVAQLVNNIPVGQVAKLRSSAKNAEEYLKNRGKLEAAGLYNPDLEERYLKYNLANWDTINNDKIWTRTSPTEMKTLKEVTESWYNNRTPEILNQADVESFNMKYDPRYNYTGFADRHLLDIAAGETPGWRGSLYADYYRDLAERKVAAKGLPYTKDDVERQLQQDIATANREYKSIKRDADDFARLDQQFKNQMALQKDAQAFQREMAEQAAKDKLDQIRARYGFKDKNGKQIDSNYSLTEELHHDLLYQGLLNSGMPIPKTELNESGKRVVKYDKDGKMLSIPISQATFDDLEFAANYQNRYAVMQQDYATKLTSGDKYDANKSWNKFKQRYGSRITNIQLAAILKKQPQSDGGFILGVDHAKLLRGVKGIMSDIRGSKININYNDRVSEVMPKDVKDALSGGDNSPVQIKFVLNDSGNNATQIFEKYNRGRTDIYATGTVTYTWETGSGTDKKKHVKTVENVQLPLGINSEINAKNTTNTSLSGANRSAYGSIDANYLKQLGQQQKANLGLFANTPYVPSMIDPSVMTEEDWEEFILNNQ